MSVVQHSSLNGFTELVPLTCIHTNPRFFKEGIARAGKKGRENLLIVAVSRQFLDNFDNIQGLWGKLGLKMSNEWTTLYELV